MPRRVITMLLLVGALSGFAATASPQQAPVALTSMDFTVVGVGIGASPEYQAVPKGITSQVLTSLSVGDADVSEIIKLLPQDYAVRAELPGPAFPTPLKLVTRPGQPFDIHKA